jgi:hypothetical protein
MWVEIQEVQKNSTNPKVWSLETEPLRDYQIRVSVFDTQNVPTKDMLGTSDVFIKAYIDHKKKQSTDTHYRCKNGCASFNYRLLFEI